MQTTIGRKMSERQEGIWGADLWRQRQLLYLSPVPQRQNIFSEFRFEMEWVGREEVEPMTELINKPDKPIPIKFKDLQNWLNN